MVKSILQPRATSIPARHRRLAAGAFWLLLATLGCGTADPNLFGTGQTQAAGSSSAGSASFGGSAGPEAGSSNASGSGGESALAGSTGYPPAAGSGGNGAGCAFACGEGGHGNAGNGGGAGEAGANEAGSGGGSPECALLSADATYLPSTKHCYLVDLEQRTFDAAQAHCTELKAHLLTLSSKEEDEFTWSLHPDEQWIGAKDGKSPTQSGVGTYTWVTDEPFDYTNWSRDQPNASKTDCVNGGSCYEHCAFQWKKGEHDGQWNDRYCMHTIASVCEWDKLP
ncbi:MAG TPA: C-type lectin domain-containing protein [Polyangiaceae bacterium]|nr:C-type lectin domain-containing protein [Polyangiaceae bacterium]